MKINLFENIGLFIPLIDKVDEIVLSLEEEFNEDLLISLKELDEYLISLFSFIKMFNDSKNKEKNKYSILSKIILSRYYNLLILENYILLKEGFDDEFVSLIIEEYNINKNILEKIIKENTLNNFQKDEEYFKQNLYNIINYKKSLLEEFKKKIDKNKIKNYENNRGYSFDSLLNDYIFSFNEYIDFLSNINFERIEKVDIDDFYRKTHSLKGNTGLILSFFENIDIKENIFYYLIKIFKEIEDLINKLKNEKSLKKYEKENLEKYLNLLVKSIEPIRRKDFKPINEILNFFGYFVDKGKKHEKKQFLIQNIVDSIQLQINFLENDKEIFNNVVNSIKRLLTIISKNKEFSFYDNKIVDIIKKLEKESLNIEYFKKEIKNDILEIIKDIKKGNEEKKENKVLLGDLLVEIGLITKEELINTLKEQKRIGEILIEKGVITKKELNYVLEKQKQLKEKIEKIETKQTSKTAVGNELLKIEKKYLDEVMNLSGELVVYKNALKNIYKEFANQNKNNTLKNILNRFREITTNIEKLVDSLNITTSEMRLVNLKLLFSRYARIVRDIEKKYNKSIKYITEGEETKLDKDIIDKIADPLMHIIRNSCDHGIETIEEREKKGKSTQGLIRLSAFSKGSFVFIKVQDDGKGIDSEIILKKAIEKGLVEKAKAKDLSKDDILKFIFYPGFSTAKKISDISGRGVGMDVVKSTMDKIGGEIFIESFVNKGTTIILKIPISITVTKGLLFYNNRIKYFIPIEYIEETIKIESNKLKIFQNNFFVSLRSQTIPVYDFKSIINNKKNIENINNYEIYNDKNSNVKKESYLLSIIILSINGNKFGLIIDRFYKELDLKIKPLNEYFKNIKLISGVSILDDGSIVLSLNPTNLAERIINKK